MKPSCSIIQAHRRVAGSQARPEMCDKSNICCRCFYFLLAAEANLRGFGAHVGAEQ